jgi:adenine-specific DNA-methyltransferase
MKETIKNAITKFDLNNFYESSLNFFNSLGYDSDKRSKLETPNFDSFIDQFRIDEENINREKALVSHWKEIQFLFQITDDDINASEQQYLFHLNQVDTTENYLKSYLFISITLKGNKYTKTDLVNISRQINKQFLQPVLILFSYNEMLCLSVIDRRMNKKDDDKDVLEKVTLIKDIRIDKPHRAHIEILHDLHLSNLNVNNFDQLHKAFKIVLNTKELNKRFYIELSNWYFRAMNVCEFPNEIDEKNIKEISLIRFISRILFAWFLKEKGLIPDEIFTQKFYDDEIKHDTSMSSSRYYKSVLQNLFFATLNSKLPDRNFQEESANYYNKQYMVFNKYRYKEYLKSPENFLDFFKKVPFLNGGLFDCLDFEDDNKKRVCVDCFSNNDKFRAKLIFPDSLFFKTDTLDFSALYNDKKKNRVAVKGLFDIFNEYKFTIDENTPIEQEIALDPELLGQTLENLLASYNPETRATARKSTGSYYTPREIVDYMVDESLIAYLTQYLKDNDETLKDMDSLDELLRDTFSYTEKSHPFSKQEVETIIDAVFKLKMLDPACGSGAFPMGILLKMVYVLERIDPENKVWKKSCWITFPMK